VVLLLAIYFPYEPIQDAKRVDHHLPVFAPKVEICYEDFVNERDRYYDEKVVINRS
jgi:hypothetical protein